MITYLFRLFLKLTGRHNLIQVVDGLIAIGRPTDTLYPAELLEQGALLGLSGLNNTLAIQSNQHWIWPYWVERQLNPDADEFIPTGVNLLTNNLSFRNWTALSIQENHWEAMLDPVGMLTVESFSWSVMPYLQVNDEYFIPSKMKTKHVLQSLQKSNWPEVITRYKTGTGIQWLSKCKAVSIHQEQILHFKCLLKNRSETSLTIKFGISLRPYNSLTIGHIHKISCKKNLWKINGRPALFMLETPDFIHASNRLLGDPIYTDFPEVASDSSSDAEMQPLKKIKLKSRSGISSGVAVYQITLAPGESVKYQFLLANKQSNVFNKRFKKNYWKKEAVKSEQWFKEHWQQWAEKGIQISLPDKTIQNAFDAVKNHLCVFDGVKHFTPGSFFYHSGWFRDSAFLSLGFDQAGFFPQVSNKIPGYIKLQNFNGYFRSQNGEWDSTGQALYIIITHIRRSGDLALLEKYYRPLLKGARWIDKTRLKNIARDIPHYGLLPAGLSAEHFGPNDHYYWDNFWSLAGLKQLLWAASLLNKDKDYAWLKIIYDNYKHDLDKSVINVSKRIDSQALPSSPYRWLDTSAIGNLAAITPMDVVAKDEFWVRPTIESLWKNNVRNGLFFQHIIHSGYNIYLSIQLAKVFLIRSDSRWKIMFKAVLDAASPTWTWPEAIHPKTGGGCMGDGDHGWAAAEFISFIRDMFVYEQKNSLYLGGGICNEWFLQLNSDTEIPFIPVLQETICQEPQTIVLKNAPTLYGLVSYSLEQKNEGILLSWSIVRNALQERVAVYFMCAELLKTHSIADTSTINDNKTLLQLETEQGSCLFKPVRK